MCIFSLPGLCSKCEFTYKVEALNLQFKEQEDTIIVL